MLLPDDLLKTLILQSRLVDEQTLADVLTFAKDTRVSLDEAIIQKDILTDKALGQIIANYCKMPFVSLSKLTIPEDVFHIIPERIARKYTVVAFDRDQNGIKLAMADPRNTHIQENIAKKTGQQVLAYYATERDINNSFQMYRRDLQKTFDELLRQAIMSADDAPIAKMVDLLITYAYRDKASDMHIEPEEKDSLIRFRIDGILHDVLYLDKKLHDRIITRIKVLSRLRTDEHLSAQDGKMTLLLEEENLDIRVSIVPIVEGEKIVLRLLSSKFRQFSLADLGMAEQDLKKVNRAMNKSYGMILATGPTGSGKTTTIYAILKILNTREKNIMTVEDPVEYRIKGVNQIQVMVKTNLTFANGLRSILRQDPNVIFVGEIRDNETAGIAVNAALTGHLVVSTLHTNDAATALPRLVDMSVEPFLVASTVNVIIAQRLVRKLCDVCKVPVELHRMDVEKDIPEISLETSFGNSAVLHVFQPKGCRTCHFTGYEGRVGVFEVIEMSQKLRKLMSGKSDSDAITKAAQEEGMTTMIEDGLMKVAKGFTTIEEVLRVTKVERL